MRSPWPWYELMRLCGERGGFVDCHRHLNTEGTITGELYSRINEKLALEEKWQLMDKVRQSAGYVDRLEHRMNASVRDMYAQGIVACRTYLHADSVLGLRELEVACRLREQWRSQGFVLEIAAYPFKGLAAQKDLEIFLAACGVSDLVIGCLPSRGRSGVSDAETTMKNLHTFFGFAMKLSTALDAQIDQKDDPREHETELFARIALEYRNRGYTGRIAATHCISLAAQKDKVIRATAKQLKEADVSVIVCPGAALSTKQDRSVRAPLHNSIAPVEFLLDAGVTVALGTDNVSDIYMPYCIGNFRMEIAKLLDAIRWQEEIETIADMATTNGRRVLGLPPHTLGTA